MVYSESINHRNFYLKEEKKTEEVKIVETPQVVTKSEEIKVVVQPKKTEPKKKEEPIMNTDVNKDKKTDWKDVYQVIKKILKGKKK